MPQQPLPDWMKSALDGRFNDLARIVGKLDEVEAAPNRKSHAPYILRVLLYNDVSEVAELLSI